MSQQLRTHSIRGVELYKVPPTYEDGAYLIVTLDGVNVPATLLWPGLVQVPSAATAAQGTSLNFNYSQDLTFKHSFTKRLGFGAWWYDRAVSTQYGGGNSAFDPEEGLILTSTVPAGTADISSALLSRSEPVVFATDFVGLDPSGGGLIAEFGGNARGAYAGFLADGTLSIVAGGGTITSGQAVHRSTGVSGTGTLVVAIDYPVLFTTLRIRVWWNGNELQDSSGLAMASAPSTGGQWSGIDPGSYMADASPVLASINDGMEAGQEIPTVLPPTAYTSVAALRHYSNQTIQETGD